MPHNLNKRRDDIYTIPIIYYILLLMILPTLFEYVFIETVEMVVLVNDLAYFDVVLGPHYHSIFGYCKILHLPIH